MLWFSAHAAPAAYWQAEIANDSPNGFKFSDYYETMP
jgi:hypothetical protein